MDSDDISRIDGMFLVIGSGREFLNKQLDMDRVKNEFIEGEHREVFAKAEAARLRETGKLPVLTVEGRVSAHDRYFIYVDLSVRNLGAVPAIDPSLWIDEPFFQREIASLAEGQQQPLRIRLPRTIDPEKLISLVLRFRIPDQRAFVERGELIVVYDPAKPEFGKVSYRSEVVELDVA